MARLEEAIFEYLSNDEGVSALVGTRIYPIRLPESCPYPAISFLRVSASRIYTYDPFPDTDAWTQARVQFNCWDSTATGAMDVGDAVLLALSGYDGSIGGDLIQSSMAVNEFDVYDAPTKHHRRILDFTIVYEDDLVTGS